MGDGEYPRNVIGSSLECWMAEKDLDFQMAVRYRCDIMNEEETSLSHDDSTNFKFDLSRVSVSCNFFKTLGNVVLFRDFSTKSIRQRDFSLQSGS
jgi:hypothetical protein